jgi:hypothetical protein
MVKSNVYSIIATIVALSILLVSCKPDLSPSSRVYIPGEIDTLSYDEPEMVTEVIAEVIPEVLPEIEEPVINTRAEVAAIYKSQLGVREKTGRNDGKDVEKYLKSVGLGKGFAWCAAFVHWCLNQAGVKNSITAWAPTAHNKKNIVYFKGKFKKEPQQADVITLYYANKGRIGHTGFFDHMQSENMTANYEGNTNRGNSNEGDGVYLTFRPVKTLYSITSWID